MRAIGTVGLGMAALLAAGGFAAAAPAQPEPQAGPPGWGPPGAWLGTRGGDRWLATGEDLWCRPASEAGVFGTRLLPDQTVCTLTPQAALVPGAACRIALAGPPEIRLQPGEVARLHLAFAPTSLTMARGSEVLTLAPAAETDLPPASQTGGIIVAAGDALGSRVRYTARIVVTTDTERPRISDVRARRNGGRAVLTISLSEAARVDGCIEPKLDRGEHYGAKTFSLFRPIHGGERAAGPTAIALGSLPAHRYRVYLRARDVDGNSTRITTLVTVPSARR